MYCVLGGMAEEWGTEFIQYGHYVRVHVLVKLVSVVKYMYLAVMVSALLVQVCVFTCAVKYSCSRSRSLTRLYCYRSDSIPA